MSLLLLRHATAGHRRPSVEESEDRLRPLDARGRRQAEALPDLYADVVAIEAVVESAATELPAARLATAHVRRSTAGDWYAGDGVCNWSGPHDTADAAVAAVQTAREDLAEQLRAAGREDLAATAPRWPSVPVESESSPGGD